MFGFETFALSTKMTIRDFSVHLLEDPASSGKSGAGKSNLITYRSEPIITGRQPPDDISFRLVCCPLTELDKTVTSIQLYLESLGGEKWAPGGNKARVKFAMYVISMGGIRNLVVGKCKLPGFPCSNAFCSFH